MNRRGFLLGMMALPALPVINKVPALAALKPDLPVLNLGEWRAMPITFKVRARVIGDVTPEQMAKLKQMGWIEGEDMKLNDAAVQKALDAHAEFYAAQPRDPGTEENAKRIAIQGMTLAIKTYLEAMKDEETIADQAYQVIGMLAVKANLMGDEEIKRALDYFSIGEFDPEFLPFVIKEA